MLRVDASRLAPGHRSQPNSHCTVTKGAFELLAGLVDDGLFLGAFGHDPRRFLLKLNRQPMSSPDAWLKRLNPERQGPGDTMEWQRKRLGKDTLLTLFGLRRSRRRVLQNRTEEKGAMPTML